MTPAQFSEIATIVYAHGIETSKGVHVLFIKDNPITFKYQPFNAYLIAGLGVCIHAHLDDQGNVVELVTDKDDDAYWSEVHTSVLAMELAITSL